MKCELCHKADAKAAIVRETKDGEEELYVCEECAKAERLRRQKKSQRTRKVTGLPPGVEMTVTEISGSGEDEPPPILGALVNAFHDMVSEIGQSAAKPEPKKAEKQFELPANRAPSEFRIRNGFHLEGLHLIGELDAVKRALHALKMDLVGVTADGVRETGHVYRLMYAGPAERAKRVAEDLLREERNARIRLFEELPRIFGDALCRALAVLKNCRLLSPGELFDLLSPLRLAAKERMLEGLGFSEVERMMTAVDLTGGEDKLEQAERDRVDAERADEMNRRFEDVVLNEKAEGKFL